MRPRQDRTAISSTLLDIRIHDRPHPSATHCRPSMQTTPPARLHRHPPAHPWTGPCHGAYRDTQDLPLTVQGKLLGVLQDREYTRVGGARPIRADVRVVAATNRDLERMVADGRFRADLYYRIKVVEIALPPLRSRGGDDIARLVRH